MARYCHGCDVVEYDVSGIQVHTLVPNSDSLLVTSGTEGLVVNTVKQLQLLDAPATTPHVCSSRSTPSNVHSSTRWNKLFHISFINNSICNLSDGPAVWSNHDH